MYRLYYLFVLLLTCSLLLGQATPTAAAGPIILPIEVMGQPGYTAAVRFNLKGAAGIDYLFLRVHRPAYADALVNPKRGAKASVRLNNGKWIDLTDETVKVYEPAASYGGLSGGFHTVKLRVPISGAKQGENVLRFRFNGTDGFTTGYRVLNMNLLRGSTRVLSKERFVRDLPKDWRPRRKTAGDIAQGKKLWETAELVDGPNKQPIKAKCGSCHAQDGRDLEYFAYSNWSIEERAKFHGLSQKESEQVSSYIRSLKDSKKVRRLGRPWNPPYQPGPGLDSKPVEYWAAGTGLKSVLQKDADMLPYLFPNGTSKKAMARVTDAYGRLNVREMPIALQFPDWNDWLPKVHPLDVWKNNYFKQGAAQQAYQELRQRLTQDGVDNLIANRDLPKLLAQTEYQAAEFVNKGSSNTKTQLRVKDGPALNLLKNGISIERAKSYLMHFVAVKNWEVMQEFDLEDKAPQIFKSDDGEVRAWPSKGRSVFSVAPHIIADDQNNFADQDPVVGEYQSTAWYQLQMTLNANQRQAVAERPMDWPYQQRHVRELGERTGVHHPLRFAATQIKAMQEKMNGEGSNRRGFELRIMHPWWNYSSASGNTGMMDALNQVQGGLRNKVVAALLREFLRVVKTDPHPSFRPEGWARVTHEASTGRWYGVEPKNYVPKAYPGTGKLFLYPQNYHADNFFRVIPLFAQNGVDSEVLNELIDWCKTMWPKGNWNSLKVQSAARVLVDSTSTQTIQAEDYINRSAQQDAQGMPWQKGNGQSGQTYVSTSDLGQCVVNGWTAGAKLDYNFAVPTDTTYHIWVRRYASDGGDNSAYFGLDGVGIDNIDNREAYGQWYWLKLGSYPLKAGEHSLSLVRREDGYQVDKFLVSSEAGHPNRSNNARQGEWISEKVAAVSDSATASLVEVYPNPVRDGQLQINTAKTTGPIDRIELLGIQGQVLLRRTASERAGIRLDVRALPPGVYVVKAYGQRQTWTEKVLVE